MRDKDTLSTKQALKEQKRQQKLAKLEKNYKENYGISYSEIQDSINKNKKHHKGFPYLKRMLAYAKEFKTSYILFILTYFLAGIICIVMPISLQHIIDNITVSEWQPAIYFAISYCGAGVISSLLYLLGYRFSTKATLNTAHKMRISLADAVIKTKKCKYDTINSGEVINRISSDTEIITYNLSNILFMLGDFLESFIFVSYLFYVNVWLALLLLLYGLSVFVPPFIYNKKYARHLNKRNRMIRDRNTGVYTETVRGGHDVKSLNIGKIFLRKLTMNSLQERNSYIDENNRHNNYKRTGWTLSYITLFIFLIVAIFALKNNVVTLGVVVIMLSNKWYTTYLFDSANQVYTNLQIMEVSAGRLCEILDDKEYPKESFGDRVLTNVKGNIEFKDVTFSYNENKTLFKDLSFKIKAGEKVGIVGKSGQGKSTIINLIPKIYEISSGKITIDGVDINELTEDSLRNTVSVVSQSPYIFNMTIKENLLFAKPDATDAEIIDVCKKAQIHDFIMEREEGYDSRIGEGGIMLSGGQRQRLAIARALLKDSKILLLDEATSALDNESQGKIKKVIDNLTDKTVIIIAHRLTTVVDCDRILVMDGNKIVADGSNSNLMKTCKVYRDLYKSENI